jgi:hypothetical protein
VICIFFKFPWFSLGTVIPVGDDWEEKTWGELIEIRSGRNQKEVLNPNGKYPVLGSAGKIMGYADKYIIIKNNIFIRSNNMGMIINPKFSIYDKRTICTAKPY